MVSDSQKHAANALVMVMNKSTSPPVPRHNLPILHKEALCNDLSIALGSTPSLCHSITLVHVHPTTISAWCPLFVLFHLLSQPFFFTEVGRAPYRAYSTRQNALFTYWRHT